MKQQLLVLPKTITLAHVKSRIGKYPEFKNVLPMVADAEKDLNELDMKDRGKAVSKAQNAAKPVTDAFRRWMDVYTKKTSKGTDKEKAAAKKMLDLLNGVFAEVEGGYRVVLKQITTLLKEIDKLTVWSDFATLKDSDIKFVNRLSTDGPKNTTKYSNELKKVMSDLIKDVNSAKDAKATAKVKDDARTKINDILAKAQREYVTGGTSTQHQNFESAHKTIRNIFLNAKFSPEDAKLRDGFLIKMDHYIVAAIKRRDEFLKLSKRALDMCATKK